MMAAIDATKHLFNTREVRPGARAATRWRQKGHCWWPLAISSLWCCSARRLRAVPTYRSRTASHTHARGALATGRAGQGGCGDLTRPFAPPRRARHLRCGLFVCTINGPNAVRNRR